VCRSVHGDVEMKQQIVAECCKVLQCVAVRCSVLQCDDLKMRTQSFWALQSVAVCCSALL